jgi:hypothetical protein
MYQIYLHTCQWWQNYIRKVSGINFFFSIRDSQSLNIYIYTYIYSLILFNLNLLFENENNTEEKDDDERGKKVWRTISCIYNNIQVHFEHIVIICQLEYKMNLMWNWSIDQATNKIRIRMKTSYAGERVTISNDVLRFITRFVSPLSHLFFLIVIVSVILIIQ